MADEKSPINILIVAESYISEDYTLEKTVTYKTAKELT